MTSEGTDTLFVAFTSKTGQSVAHNRHIIFLFRFFGQREDIFYVFYRGSRSSYHNSIIA